MGGARLFKVVLLAACGHSRRGDSHRLRRAFRRRVEFAREGRDDVRQSAIKRLAVATDDQREDDQSGKRMIERLKERAAVAKITNLKAILGDATQSIVPEASFDGVICTDVRVTMPTRGSFNCSSTICDSSCWTWRATLAVRVLVIGGNGPSGPISRFRNDTPGCPTLPGRADR